MHLQQLITTYFVIKQSAIGFGHLNWMNLYFMPGKKKNIGVSTTVYLGHEKCQLYMCHTLRNHQKVNSFHRKENTILWTTSKELNKMSWRAGFRINLKCTGRSLFYLACFLCVYVALLVTQLKSKCWIPTFQAADILFYQWEIRFSQSYYRKPNCFIPRSQRISLASSGKHTQSCNLQSESNFKPHLKNEN